MKKIVQTIMLFAVLLIPWATSAQSNSILCGDDPAETFANAESMTATTSYFPGYSFYNYSYTEVIIHAYRLGSLSEIKGMEFYVNSLNTGSSEFENCEIYLMNTSARGLEDGFIQDTSNFQLVYSGSLNCSDTGWHLVTFSSTFYRDGRNVLVAIRRNNGSYAQSGTFGAYTDSAYTLARYVYRDSSPYTIGSVTGGTPSHTMPLYRMVGCATTACNPPTVTIDNYDGRTVSFSWQSLADSVYVTLLNNEGQQVIGSFTYSTGRVENYYLPEAYFPFGYVYVYAAALCHNGSTSDWNYDVIPITCDAEEQCPVYFVLNDQHGDGWQGAVLDIFDTVSGMIVGSMTTLQDNTSGQPSSDTVIYNFCKNRVYSISYRSGTNDSDVSFQIVGSEGQVYASVSNPTEGVLGYFTHTCPCLPVTIPVAENFEDGIMPECWSTEGPGTWSVGTGDYSSSTGSHGGSYNAKITHSSTGNATKLVSPVIDFTGVSAAQLTFWHVQRSWYGDQDVLNVYYRTSENASWQTIATYTNEIATWTQEVINLPNLNSTYQVAFEMVDGYGYGVAIDDISINLPPSCTQPDIVDITYLPYDNGEGDYQAIVTWDSTGAQMYEVVWIEPSQVRSFLTYGESKSFVFSPNYESFVKVRAICGDGDTSEWSDLYRLYVGYCSPNPTSVDGNGITSVSFGGMTNTTHPTSSGYADYSTMSGSVAAGTTATVNITYATGYTYGTIIWVDWNNNYQFDSNEVVYAGTSASSNPTTLTATFDIPATQPLGSYRMRIVGADSFFDSYTGSLADAADANPCATYSWGVAEDYTLVVTETPSCLAITQLTVVATASDSITIGWTDTLNSGATYSVYMVTPTGQTLLASGITGGMYTVTNLVPMTDYVFGVVANCSASDASSIVTINATTDCEGGNCNVTLVMNDSYGDGWNGNAVSVLQPNHFVGTYTIASGHNNVEVVSVCAGTPIDFSWTTGSYAGETSFAIVNALGDTVYQGSGYDLANNDTVFFSLGSCNDTVQVPDPDTISFTIAVNDATMGTTSPAPGTYQFLSDTTIYVTAIPGTGYALVGWVASFTYFGETISDTLSSSDEEFENPVELEFDPEMAELSDLTLTALFAAETTDCTGGSCDIYIVKNDSYGDGWNGNAISVSQPGRTVGVYTLQAGAMGVDTVSVCAGTAIEFGWIAGNWSSEVSFSILNANGDLMYNGHGADLTDDSTFLAIDSCNAVSTYTPDSMLVNIAVNNSSMGTTIPAPGAHYFYEGDTCSVVAVPNTGYMIEGWTVVLVENGDTAINQTVMNPAADVFSLFTSPVVVQPGYGSMVFYVTANFVAEPTCLAVTNLAVDSASANSVSVSWTGTAGSYSLYNGAAFVANVTGTSYTFTGLATATAYTFGVVAVCSSTDSSEMSVVAASTECDIISTYPYTQGFGSVPACWSSLDVDGDGYGWELVSGAMHSASYDNTVGVLTPDNWLITPHFQLAAGTSYEVTWNANPQDANWPAEHYGLYVSTTGSSDTSYFTLLQDWTLTSTGHVPVVDLSSYAGQNIYLAFRHWNCTDMFRIAIDNFELREQAGANQITVTLTQNNPMYGSVSGGGVYTLGDSVTVSATAAAGYQFSGWIGVTGAPVSTANPYTFVATTDVTLQAVFASSTAETYTITVDVNDSTMGYAIGGGDYAEGSIAMLMAYPNPGYRFVNWTWNGNVLSTDNPFQMNVTSGSVNYPFIANFEVDTTSNDGYLTLVTAVNDTAMGTMTPVPGTYHYHLGDVVQFSATPYNGYHLESATISMMVMGITLIDTTIYMDEMVIPDLEVEEEMLNMTIGVTVNFAANSTETAILTVAVNDSDMGYVLINGQQTDSYSGYVGSTVSLEAVANQGYHFEYWSDGVTDATRTLTLQDTATYLTATFVMDNAIEMADMLDNIKVYPNPTYGVVTIDADGVVKVEVMDLNGRTVATYESTGRIDLSSLGAGTYVLRIQTLGGFAVRRVVKR